MVIDVLRAFTTAAYAFGAGIAERLSGRAVLRTGSGTRCVVAAPEASEVWLGSLVVAAVTGSRAASRHESGDADFPVEDVSCAVAIDAFEFAMKTERHAGRVIARPFLP